MIENIFNVLGILFLGTGISYLILKYLSQKIFENYIQRRFEKYKNQLEKELITHQILFSSLQKERADVTKEIFSSILKLEDSTYRYTVTFNQNQLGGVKLDNYTVHMNHLDSTLTSYTELNKKINDNEIYFSAVFIDELRKLHNVYVNTILDLGRKIETNIINLNNDSFFEPEYFKTKNDLLDQNINQLKNILSTEFRKLIGV
ncbi:hypothetical protein SAMN05192550_3199 [Flavobacterium glycines]|uniref:Uncharacterized protein n=1 Tax=Flavobacterium glycines TaxID=551990 RepID=A0A1B9DX40_9FLAO|nr:hypothetical protein [Flavobacterium glycines]OCB74258.1 hypothetical protein FBGL_02295 [Flavobacterium glycines]GEL12231.1 hypothetical protein FGL01_29700 [Flavobacterium glycines]SDK02538.1 hypothetical protein SAMN05192550_3199 [Flavobacterium glycines]